MNNLPGAARELVDHIDLLKRQLRSQVTPTIGDTEELFALAEQVDLELKTSDGIEPCALPSCKRPALSGRLYCSRCDRVLQLVTTRVTSEAAAIAREKVEAMLQGKAAWPDAMTPGVKHSGGGVAGDPVGVGMTSGAGGRA